MTDQETKVHTWLKTEVTFTPNTKDPQTWPVWKVIAYLYRCVEADKDGLFSCGVLSWDEFGHQRGLSSDELFAGREFEGIFIGFSILGVDVKSILMPYLERYRVEVETPRVDCEAGEVG